MHKSRGVAGWFGKQGEEICGRDHEGIYRGIVVVFVGCKFL